MLTLLDQLFVKPLHHRVALNRAEHSHVKRGAYGRSATFDAASTLHRTAGNDTGGNLFANARNGEQAFCLRVMMGLLVRFAVVKQSFFVGGFDPLPEIVSNLPCKHGQTVIRIPQH